MAGKGGTFVNPLSSPLLEGGLGQERRRTRKKDSLEQNFRLHFYCFEHVMPQLRILSSRELEQIMFQIPAPQQTVVGSQLGGETEHLCAIFSGVMPPALGVMSSNTTLVGP